MAAPGPAVTHTRTRVRPFDIYVYVFSRRYNPALNEMVFEQPRSKHEFEYSLIGLRCKIHWPMMDKWCVRRCWRRTVIERAPRPRTVPSPFLRSFGLVQPARPVRARRHAALDAGHAPGITTNTCISHSYVYVYVYVYITYMLSRPLGTSAGRPRTTSRRGATGSSTTTATTSGSTSPRTNTACRRVAPRRSFFPVVLLFSSLPFIVFSSLRFDSSFIRFASSSIRL